MISPKSREASWTAAVRSAAFASECLRRSQNTRLSLKEACCNSPGATTTKLSNKSSGTQSGSASSLHFPPKSIPVQPVIVLPGWFVETKGNFAVKVMNATYLVGYLKGAKPLFTLGQLEPVLQRLDERCRTVEF